MAGAGATAGGFDAQPPRSTTIAAVQRQSKQGEALRAAGRSVVVISGRAGGVEAARKQVDCTISLVMDFAHAVATDGSSSDRRAILVTSFNHPDRCFTVAFLRRSAVVACALVLAGCASGGIADKTLELVGLKTPPPPAIELPAAAGELPTLNGQMPRPGGQRRVAVRIHAGQVLNTDASGRSLAVVVRIYSLRGITQFSQATYAMFAAGTSDKPFTNADVVASKEVVLVPGQKYEMLEPLAAEVTNLAVVALFRSPDSQRWRFVFDARGAAQTGITLGVHGCAMSVAVGEPVGAPLDSRRLAGVQCR
ncbi:MAG: type VI secretion system lipoprotein TssJ [Caldimonas sp.]